MSPEYFALLDKPWLLVILLAIGAGIGIAIERFVEGEKRAAQRANRRAYFAGRNAGRKKKYAGPAGAEQTEAPIVDLAADQLSRVMKASFKPRVLLNQSERRLLGCIDQALDEYSPGWRAMGQVSLGEILWSEDKDAYLAVNSKRVDLLIVDADCKPLHAIEFQGTGHHMSKNTAARDAVKREALRRAGIGYVEVVSGDTPAEVREMVRKLIVI